MPLYFFRIRQGKYHSAPAEGIELPSPADARKEAAMICSDMARDIVSELGENPEWQIDVTDQSGALVFRITLTAQSFATLEQH